MWNKCKEIDQFGEGISINYRGNNTYKTVPGAILSLISLVIVMGYGGYKIVEMVTMSNPSINLFDRSIDAADVSEFKFDENKMQIYLSTNAIKKPYILDLYNISSSEKPVPENIAQFKIF